MAPPDSPGQVRAAYVGSLQAHRTDLMERAAREKRVAMIPDQPFSNVLRAITNLKALEPEIAIISRILAEAQV